MKIYHIYSGNTCLLHSIPEEEFEVTWKTLKCMMNIIHTDMKLEDLEYEELEIHPLTSAYID